MSITDHDRLDAARAAQLPIGDDADAVRAYTGDGDPLGSYVAAYREARELARNLAAVVRRLDADDDNYTCSACGAKIGIFMDRAGWRHYRGDGTAASPVELYDAGHEATLTTGTLSAVATQVSAAAPAGAGTLVAEAFAAAWCKGCHHATASVPCELCDGPACAACGRCPRCDGTVEALDAMADE